MIPTPPPQFGQAPSAPFQVPSAPPAPSKNSYLEDVIQSQQAFNHNVKAHRAPVPSSNPGFGFGGYGGFGNGGGFGNQAQGRQSAFFQARPPVAADSKSKDASTSGSEVRITGFCWWTSVIVPPNMWVVHTRRGHEQPLHLGMGISFYYNKYTDSFLVAPSTLQTLLISAKSICKERQGVLISAYVQYAIEDFKLAYQKLDFSDVDDPMRIVNIQLQEQCEASIKDKVATLSIDEVLSDKRPIVDELTSRLRSVSDGQGLKIIQVQIKEAVVASSKLWDTLQLPFREEQTRIAKLAELDREKVIRSREVEDRIDTERRLNETKLETEKRRSMQEVELARAKAALEEVRVQAELASIQAQARVDQAKAEAGMVELKMRLEKDKVESEHELNRNLAQLKLIEEKMRIENSISESKLQELLIRALPSIVEKMPKPEHAQTIHLSSDGKGGAPEAVLALAGITKVVKGLLHNTSSSVDI